MVAGEGDAGDELALGFRETKEHIRGISFYHFVFYCKGLLARIFNAK